MAPGIGFNEEYSGSSKRAFVEFDKCEIGNENCDIASPKDSLALLAESTLVAGSASLSAPSKEGQHPQISNQTQLPRLSPLIHQRCYNLQKMTRLSPQGSNSPLHQIQGYIDQSNSGSSSVSTMNIKYRDSGTRNISQKVTRSATSSKRSSRSFTPFSSDEDLKRQAHIVSEQRRRQCINEGFEELKHIVPSCNHATDSKAIVLRKAASYIQQLASEISILRSVVNNSTTKNYSDKNDNVTLNNNQKNIKTLSPKGARVPTSPDFNSSSNASPFEQLQHKNESLSGNIAITESKNTVDLSITSRASSPVS